MNSPIHKEPETSKFNNIPLTFAESILNNISFEDSSKESIPHKEPAKKLRWYECKPRLIINNYYKNNFALKYENIKDTNKLNMGSIWSSTINSPSKITEKASKAFKNSLINSENTKIKKKMILRNQTARPKNQANIFRIKYSAINN